MKSAVIFFLSFFVALFLMAIERFAGIGWDFHPDAVTYTTLASDVTQSILSESYLLIFNNGYYFWAEFLGMSLFLLTVANLIMFSITNVMLYRIHDRYASRRTSEVLWFASLGILLFNPYRVHLATTVLKDTMIIMFTVMIAVYSTRRSLIVAPLLFLLRIASVLYFMIKLRRKYLIICLVVALLFAFVYSNSLADRLSEFNSADMQLREFDRVPNFRSLGLLGVMLRAALWPLLALTGVFAVISPALAFFPVAIGSLLNQVYCYIVVRRPVAPLVILVPMAVFAALVTGYTAYIRYVYPLIVVLPILVLMQHAGAEAGPTSKKTKRISRRSIDGSVGRPPAPRR